MRPGEKRQNGSRRATVIAEVKMVSARIIEVDRALDEPQPKQPDIEVKVALRIARDGRDMMKAAHRNTHDGQCCRTPSGGSIHNCVVLPGSLYRETQTTLHATNTAID